MFDWLVENSSTVYLLLGTVGLVFLGLWWRTRQRKYAVGVGVVAALAGALFLLGSSQETDAQQIERKIHAMGAAVRARDLNRIFEHISPEFRYGSFDRAALRKASEAVLRSREVREIILWEVEHVDDPLTGRSRFVAFHAKPRGNWGGEAFYRVRAEFVRDPDGQWRMKGFQVFNPFVETHTPLHVPGIGLP